MARRMESSRRSEQHIPGRHLALRRCSCSPLPCVNVSCHCRSSAPSCCWWQAPLALLPSLSDRGDIAPSSPSVALSAQPTSAMEWPPPFEVVSLPPFVLVAISPIASHLPCGASPLPAISPRLSLPASQATLPLPPVSSP